MPYHINTSRKTVIEVLGSLHLIKLYHIYIYIMAWLYIEKIPTDVTQVNNHDMFRYLISLYQQAISFWGVYKTIEISAKEAKRLTQGIFWYENCFLLIVFGYVSLFCHVIHHSVIWPTQFYPQARPLQLPVKIVPVYKAPRTSLQLSPMILLTEENTEKNLLISKNF